MRSTYVERDFVARRDVTRQLGTVRDCSEEQVDSLLIEGVALAKLIMLDRGTGHRLGWPYRRSICAV